MTITFQSALIYRITQKHVLGPPWAGDHFEWQGPQLRCHLLTACPKQDFEPMSRIGTVPSFSGLAWSIEVSVVLTSTFSLLAGWLWMGGGQVGWGKTSVELPAGSPKAIMLRGSEVMPSYRAYLLREENTASRLEARDPSPAALLSPHILTNQSLHFFPIDRQILVYCLQWSHADLYQPEYLAHPGFHLDPSWLLTKKPRNS